MSNTGNKKANTIIRHNLVRERVDKVYKEAKEKSGYSPHLDEIIRQVSLELGYSTRYIKEILSKGEN